MNDTHRWIALDAGGALGTEEDVAWSDVADRTTTVLLHHRDGSVLVTDHDVAGG